MNAQEMIAPVEHPPGNKKRLRKILYASLAGLVLTSGAAYLLHLHSQASRYISTDDAYTATEVAQITSLTSGIILEVAVNDTQKVKRGDIVAALDNTDARIAVVEAEAELGSAIRRVKGYKANDATLAAQIAARDAETDKADAQLALVESDYQRAQIEWKRRNDLDGTGSISGEDLTRSKNVLTNAEANLAAARAAVMQARANKNAALGTRQTNAALIENVDLENNPEVSLASARLQQAKIDLERTVIRAPMDGVVARRQVQVGQRVQTGAVLFSIVPLQQIHVDANFKEVQLRLVRVGQKVQLVSDRYGPDVVYHGTVEGFSGGTGSAFAVIPAQNATGNWIKVVQRLPIRIRIDSTELSAHPLQVGLSMKATVDTRS